MSLFPQHIKLHIIQRVGQVAKSYTMIHSRYVKMAQIYVKSIQSINSSTTVFPENKT